MSIALGKRLGCWTRLICFPWCWRFLGMGNHARIRYGLSVSVGLWVVLRTSLHPQLRQDVLLSAIRRFFSSPCWSFPEQTIIKELNDPLVLWDTFATTIDLDPATRSDISDELASSVRWQTYSYDHPPNAPTLLSPSIDWEQSIVEGHPTHPVRVSFCAHKEVAHR
jgi:hypothetical protein